MNETTNENFVFNQNSKNLMSEAFNATIQTKRTKIENKQKSDGAIKQTDHNIKYQEQQLTISFLFMSI